MSRQQSQVIRVCDDVGRVASVVYRVAWHVGRVVSVVQRVAWHVGRVGWVVQRVAWLVQRVGCDVQRVGRVCDNSRYTLRGHSKRPFRQTLWTFKELLAFEGWKKNWKPHWGDI